jgi:ABC-type branched-subunit amino acid transport system substrate-binding protein
MRRWTEVLSFVGTALLLAGTPRIAAPAGAAPIRGVKSDEVVFGMSGPFSGPVRELGRQMKTGIEIAFAAQNEAGGVHGRKLRLVADDDGYDPERAKVAVRDLVERRNAFALVGNVGTATAAAALPYALDKGILFFGALSGADLLRNDPPDRFAFNYRASYWEEAAAAVKYLVEVRRIRPSQVAVFAQEDAYGDAGFEGVLSMLRKYRYDPSRVIRVGYKRNTADVTEAVQTIKRNASKIRAVVMVPTSKAAARFVQKVKNENLDLVLSSISDVGATELSEQLTQLGPGYAEGVIVTQVAPLPTSKATAIMKYHQDLSRYAGTSKPDSISLEGYLMATLLIEGLRRAGPDLNTDTLVAALESIKDYDLGIGALLSLGPSEHQASHKVWVTVMDGQGAYRAIRFE